MWLAQPALNVENFDEAMSMGQQELMKLVECMPDPPPVPTAEVRVVAQVCGPNDPILDSPLLEALVDHLERSFNEFFYEVFPDGSDLAPADYFGRDMGWHVAKNIDVITQASDLALVLASEAMTGQFLCLFDAFCKWKTEFATSTVFAEAAARRASSNRPNVSNKVPQSCEGLQLCKARSEASKLALKSAREKEKREATLVRAEAKARRGQAELEAKARRLSSKLPVIGLGIPPSGQPGHRAAIRNTSKRGAYDELQGVTSKTKLADEVCAY